MAVGYSRLDSGMLKLDTFINMKNIYIYIYIDLMHIDEFLDRSRLATWPFGVAECVLF